MADKGPLLTSCIIFYLSIGGAIFQIFEEENWKSARDLYVKEKEDILKRFNLTKENLTEILKVWTHLYVKVTSRFVCRGFISLHTVLLIIHTSVDISQRKGKCRCLHMAGCVKPVFLDFEQKYKRVKSNYQAKLSRREGGKWKSSYLTAQKSCETSNKTLMCALGVEQACNIKHWTKTWRLAQGVPVGSLSLELRLWEE